MPQYQKKGKEKECEIFQPNLRIRILLSENKTFLLFTLIKFCEQIEKFYTVQIKYFSMTLVLSDFSVVVKKYLNNYKVIIIYFD